MLIETYPEFLFSGMAAANAVMETLQQGDHIIASKQVTYLKAREESISKRTMNSFHDVQVEA